MSLFYYGINPKVIFLVALVIACLSVFLFFKKLYSQTVTAGHGKMLLASAITVSAMLYVNYDLQSTINTHQANSLEKLYATSIEYVSLGENFRNEMSDIAVKNGIVVTAEQSYKGSQIYTDYITKEDWNKLAVIYNQSNLPK